MAQKHAKLGQWYATAICGNDILSSCLYVSGIAVLFSGVYAPLVLIVVTLVLLFYKSVYTEVVEALPINGGSYNCLINATSKTTAAVAGVVGILAYIATAVISAKVSVGYVSSLIPIPVMPTTIVILLLFALLVSMGIKDSAKVAFYIFLFHIFSLTLFVIFGAIYFLSGGHSYFLENLQNTASQVTKGGLFQALFFGFSASLLAVAGFASSANFVELQQNGIFRKTLRNMVIGVGIFNPLIALVILNSSSLTFVAQGKDFLLAKEAVILGGNTFQYIIVTDALLVLCGAVLTAYIAVSGLASRMASDAVLPNFLTHRNRKGSYSYIIIFFFVLCSSILFLTNGNLLYIAGVYTIAFLIDLSLMALGNMILRQTRDELKRTYKAPMVLVVIALLATAVGIIGNINIDVNNLSYFALYFIPAVLLVLLVVYQDHSVGMLLHLTKKFKRLHSSLSGYFEDITQGTLVAFINHVDRLHPILNYINVNETARNIILVHCKNWDDQSDMQRHHEIKEVLPYLKKAGFFSHLNIKLIYKSKPFGPEAINEVSRELKVRKNRILIGSIHKFHDFDYSELGGVRIII